MYYQTPRSAVPTTMSSPVTRVATPLSPLSSNLDIDTLIDT